MMNTAQFNESLDSLVAATRRAALLAAESKVLRRATHTSTQAELLLIQAIADDIHLLIIGGES
jgi:hypothetical protein